MAMYRVELQRQDTYVATIEVEAKDEAEAEKLAAEKVLDFQWGLLNACQHVEFVEEIPQE